MRHELHKVREKARDAADDQKFAVQRTIAGFHQQQNSSLQEFQKCQALRAEKDLELASLKDQEAVQRERAREQRAEMEAEFEAQLAPMREGAPPPLRTALPCVSGAHSRPPSVPVPLARQRTGGLRRPLASDPLQCVPRRPDGENTGWWARLERTSTKTTRWRAPPRKHASTVALWNRLERCFAVFAPIHVFQVSRSRIEPPQGVERRRVTARNLLTLLVRRDHRVEGSPEAATQSER